MAPKPKVMPHMCGTTARTPWPAAAAATIRTLGPGVTEAAMAKPSSGNQSDMGRGYDRRPHRSILLT